ncbi:MAG TPA: hypothetical protein VD962_06715 [Rubricoccaceae bacterium]|nr:hypothetical protein [Rubricoccaceae bacterium]
MIEVRLIEKKGCAWVAGSVFSLGLLPLFAARQTQRSPERLTVDEMILRNGTCIPWGQFTRVTITEVYLNRRYIRTQYALKYPGGTVLLANDAMYDADRVIQFVLDHVPPEALQR